MADLINGRTPEEIKAGLRACTTAKTPGYGCNAHCPYLNAPNCWLPVKADALALIERLEAERDAALAKVPRWISVEERLPRCGERVLVTNDGSVWEAYLSISHKWVRQEFVWAAKVTHWMPLPEPPKEDV